MQTTISFQHYVMLEDLAARQEGIISARSLHQFGDFGHPGDPIGKIVCEAWRIDPTRPSVALTAYMSELRTECKLLGIIAPTLAEVLTLLPQAINSDRYPDLDLTAMCELLAEQVPLLYGEQI
jgi:hypothetical protein